MNLPVVLRRAARDEFDAAIDWYERQSSGLGSLFGDRVEAVFERISSTPEMHAAVYREIRRAPIRGFPYSIYYRIRGGRIVVLAVFHNKHNPQVWKSRG